MLRLLTSCVRASAKLSESSSDESSEEDEEVKPLVKGKRWESSLDDESSEEDPDHAIKAADVSSRYYIKTLPQIRLISHN